MPATRRAFGFTVKTFRRRRRRRTTPSPSTKTTLRQRYFLLLSRWPVWPDFAKFHCFGKYLNIFGNLFKVYLVLGKVFNSLWHNLYAFGQIYIAVNCKILKAQSVIWSHCSRLSSFQDLNILLCLFSCRNYQQWLLANDFSDSGFLARNNQSRYFSPVIFILGIVAGPMTIDTKMYLFFAKMTFKLN